jgi:serine/threonine protein kinase
MLSFIGVCSSSCIGDVVFKCWHASAGRELATGRKIAIKKIKVGQFKDGLDMSAVREVKYLRELHHPNVIEVGTPCTASPDHLSVSCHRSF